MDVARRCLFLSSLIVFVLSPCVMAEDGALKEQSLRWFGVISPAESVAVEKSEAILGRALFWDSRLSGNGKTSCADCHQAQAWGADPRPFSRDARGKDTTRNSQTVFNSTMQPFLRWTGDRRSAAHQAEKSLTGSMGFSSPEEVVPLLHKYGYQTLFEMAYPSQKEPVTPSNYAKALQCYEETLVTPAPFDRFLSGEMQALTTQQKKGLQTFLDKGCAECHNGTLLGGKSLKVFGVRGEYGSQKTGQKDFGLFQTTNVEADRNRFRVSMLRNVARTGPYFHDGGVTQLREAVQIMADVQLGEALADNELDDIVSFLEALTGEVPAHFAPPK